MDNNKWNILLNQTIEENSIKLLKEADFNIITAAKDTAENVKTLMKDANAVFLMTGIKIKSFSQILQILKFLKLDRSKNYFS